MKVFYTTANQLSEIADIERNLFEVIEKLKKEFFYPDRLRLVRQYEVLRNIYSSYCIESYK